MPTSEALDQRLSLLYSPQGKGVGLASITMRTALQQLAGVTAGAGAWGLTSQTSVKRWGEHTGNCARFRNSLPSDTPASARPHFPTLCKQQPTGDPAFKHRSLLGGGIPV